MMNQKCILRIAKLKTLHNVRASARHTLREMPTDNADQNRTEKNFNSLKSSAEIIKSIKEKIEEVRANKKFIKKTSVPCIEYFFGASPKADVFKNSNNMKDYFRSCYEWLEKKHGKENIVSFHIHRDETTPHMVAYIFPRTKDGRLSADSVVGNREALSDMQTDFAEHVSHHGLERGIKGSKAKHTSIKEYYARVNAPTPKPPSALDALKGSQHHENIKIIHAKNQESTAKAKKQAEQIESLIKANEALVRKNQAQATQLEEKKFSDKATATLIRENFDKEELAKKMGVQLKGKGDVIDALRKEGKAQTFGHAVALIVQELRKETIKPINPIQFNNTPLETPKKGLNRPKII